MRRISFIKTFITMLGLPFLTFASEKSFNSKEDFKCPRGIKTELTMCNDCPDCLTEIVYRTTKDVHLPNYVQTGCEEMHKKHLFATCGCQGTDSCICGFEEDFCFSTRTYCPFCGRQVKRTYSMLHKMAIEDTKRIFGGLYNPVIKGQISPLI